MLHAHGPQSRASSFPDAPWPGRRSDEHTCRHLERLGRRGPCRPRGIVPAGPGDRPGLAGGPGAGCLPLAVDRCTPARPVNSLRRPGQPGSGQRGPRGGRLAHPAHRCRAADRRRPGAGRGRNAGHHPQPAGRPRHPGRQCRCRAGRGARHPLLRRVHDARLHPFRVRGCRGRLAAGVPGGLAGPRRRHRAEARPGRCGHGGGPRIADQRRADGRPGGAGPLQVLAGRHARCPGRARDAVRRTVPGARCGRGAGWRQAVQCAGAGR